MRTLCIWAGLAALALTAGARADDAYTIKLSLAPDVGKSIVVKTHDKETNATTLFGPDGKEVLSNKDTGERDEVYTETVLEKGDGPAKKFKRTYEKATRTAAGKTFDLPFQGRTIVFELKDGKYQATAEGTPALDKGLLTALAGTEDRTRDASDLEAIIPTKPVKVGDKWAVDVKLLAKSLGKDKGPEIDPDKSKGEVTLTKAYKKDGRQFGVIEMTVNVAFKTLPGGLTFDPPAKGDMTAKLDIAIDGLGPVGTETNTHALKGKGVVTDGGEKRTVDLSINSEGTKSVTPGK